MPYVNKQYEAYRKGNNEDRHHDCCEVCMHSTLVVAARLGSDGIGVLCQSSLRGGGI